MLGAILVVLQALDRNLYNFIMSTKGLDYETLNENVKKAQYAVRGELYLRASELQMQGKKV